MRLLIKNMVCRRCVLAVEGILKEMGLPFRHVILGEVELESAPDTATRKKLDESLRKLGFELIETRLGKLIEDIRHAAYEYIEMDADEKPGKFSAFLTKKIPHDYSYLSDLFSSVEGITIEQFLIRERIEKVKEYLVYNQLSLTEIAYRLGYSSVHHLSSQFRKVTGMTPSSFRKLRSEL